MKLRTSSKAAPAPGGAAETGKPTGVVRRSDPNLAEFTGSCAAMAGPRSVQMGLLTVMLAERRRGRKMRFGRGAVA